MHAGISKEFADGSDINETALELGKNPQLSLHIPPIKLVVVDLPLFTDERQDMANKGYAFRDHSRTKRKHQALLFTQDHRRLVAFRIAGIQINAQFVAQPNVYGNFTTGDLGMTLELRERVVGGGNNCTFPSGAKYYYHDGDDWKLTYLS